MWEPGAGCQSSSAAKASGGMSASTSARLGSTLCVTARPLAFTSRRCPPESSAPRNVQAEAGERESSRRAEEPPACSYLHIIVAVNVRSDG